MRLPVRRLRALVRPLRSVSGLGWAVLGLGAVLSGAGWWLGWLELLVVGLGLLGMAALAVALTLGRSTYDVDLEVVDRRVTVGQRVTGRVEVRSRARRRLLPARIELPVGRQVAEFPLPWLRPGARHEELFSIPTTRRSVVQVGPVRSVRGDPWGLIARRVAWTGTVEVCVHPVLVPLTGAAAGVLRDLEGRPTRVVSNSDLSFHALRDYEPGDDRRHIHWKTTARTGTLMVRQFEDTRRTHTAVALATCAADYRDEDELELAVAAAASIGVSALREDRSLTFLAGSRLRTHEAGALLDDVARVTTSPGGRAATALVPWISSDAPDASVVVLITGSVPELPVLRAAAERLRGGAPTLLLTCRSGDTTEVTARGSLAVARLGALEDLPLLLRRVVGT
ncbi:DUF58 domain-containing protein [Isoptericola sp. b441]|uniref:DUF58 domain-containing protein n=1 Tax=Actinotalea lenta TaxID=3064654 RepID=A0ABT9D9C5_9CELL|nr:MULTISPECIES: DUF58 domain-containing protein [unclassified Isoptericola]MDO8105778.1 DUF58 domain-containing protein [Isoptericola sp. b441]MDO8122483.1 DUF58 domain-containing protein [Isoptericola sp. b490]